MNDETERPASPLPPGTYRHSWGDTAVAGPVGPIISSDLLKAAIECEPFALTNLPDFPAQEIDWEI